MPEAKTKMYVFSLFKCLLHVSLYFCLIILQIYDESGLQAVADWFQVMKASPNVGAVRREMSCVNTRILPLL